MEEGNLAVLVDAKTEYTHQFIQIIKPNIYKCINNIFLKSKLSKNVFKNFQEELSLIPKWNQNIIDNEYNTILNLSGCDWLDELITAVFVSHTRILTSINMNREKGKINLKIPQTSQFIHKCYIDVARHIWKNSYLFNNRVSNDDKQKNRRECEKIIEHSIIETIRKEIPIKDILKEYLGTEYRNNSTNPKRNDMINKIEKCSEEKLEKLQCILDKDANTTKVEDNIVKNEVAEGDEAKITRETEKDSREVLRRVAEEASREARVAEARDAEARDAEARDAELRKAADKVYIKVEDTVLHKAADKVSMTEETPKAEEAEEAEKRTDTLDTKHEENNIENILKIEELDLEQLKDLNEYKEIYLDDPIEIQTIEEDKGDIKKISITDKNNKKITEVVNLEGMVTNKEDPDTLNKYKEKSNYKFF